MTSKGLANENAGRTPEYAPNRIVIHLVVNDIEAMKKFYLDGMAFVSVKDCVMGDGSQKIILAKKDNLGVQVQFHSARLTDGSRCNKSIHLEFGCENISMNSQLLDSIKAGYEKRSFPYGEVLMLKDPEGNTITLSEYF